MNRQALLVISTFTAVIGLSAASCGSGDSKPDKARAQATREQGQSEAERERGNRKGPQIALADQTAFIQISKGVGLVRVRAAPVVVGQARRLDSPAPLIASRRIVASLRPRDQGLARLRDRLLVLMTGFGRGFPSGVAGKRAARAAIGAADRIEAGLRAYVHRRPGIGGLIPD